jgi:dihydroflavonol-4-reductase
LVRPTSNLKNLEGLKAETAIGDLRDASSLEKAMAGCETVFHVAADYRLWVRDPQEMYLSNVEGTRGLLEAARKNKVRCVVYTSSVATIGFTGNGQPADEDSPVSLADMIGHYKRSKFLAEAVAREAAANGQHVVIVNPSTPVGPGDGKPTPTGQLVLDAAAGRMPAYVDTGLNVVHVDDVAAGHLLAHAQGRSGERYILGGEDLSLAEILAQISRLVGRKPPSIRLPYAAVLPIAYVAEAYAALTGRSTRVTLEGVRMSRKRMFFSSDKARRELGYRWRDPIDAFADAVRWYRDGGRLG